MSFSRRLSSVLFYALLITGFASTLAFTSCEGGKSEIVTPGSGNGTDPGTNTGTDPGSPSYSDIMKDSNKSFVEKMTVVETALNEGKVSVQQAKDLIKLAVESMGGTNQQKMAVFDIVFKSDKVGLKIKLYLTEVAYQKEVAGPRDAFEEIGSLLGLIKGKDE